MMSIPLKIRALSLATAVIMLFSMTSCSDDRSQKDDDIVETKPILEYVPDDEIDEATKNDTIADSIEETEEPVEEKERFVSELEARYSAHEKNGYSLWYTTYGRDDGRKCVDSQGYITFNYGDANDVTNVYNNAFIASEFISEGNTRYTVYKMWQASTGKLLYTASNKDNQYIIELDYSFMNLFEDGYTIVVNSTESYNGVTYEMGILGCDGEWVVPLSKDHPILKQMGDNASVEAFEKMRYLGEDILHFSVDIHDHYFYNIKTNTAVKVVSELTESQTDSVLQCAGPFVNGICVDVYGFGGGFCKISSAGKISIMNVNFSEKLHENIRDFYYDAKNDRVIRMGYTYHEDGFSVFDSKGAIIKKHSDVTIADTNGFTAEGFAQIVMENKEGTKYYTIMNTSGEFLFDPIKLETGKVIDAESGYMVENGETRPSDTYTVVDKEGNILFKTESSGEFGYKNGIVCYNEVYTEILP